MRLGLLAEESTILPVLPALCDHPELQLVCCWTPKNAVAEFLSRAAPEARQVEHWDAVVVEPDLDAVLIAGGSAEMASTARALAVNGKRLLVLTDLSAGPAQLFEYLAVWEEAPHQVSPLFVSGMRQAAKEIFHRPGETEQQGQDSPCWKVEFQRTVPGDGPIRREEVDRWLFQDLDWILTHAGRPRQVTMQMSGPDSEQAIEATVILYGASIPEVRWTLQRKSPPAGWQLKLHGHAAPVLVHTSHDDAVDGPATAETAKTVGSDSVDADVADQLHSWLQAGAENRQGRPWTDIVPLAEIGAAAWRSQSRRRTIDLHFEEASERNQFKSQMSAIGCGTLLWALLGMVAMLLFGSLFDPRDREYRTSAAAGFVLTEQDFLPQQAELSPAGAAHLQTIAGSWSETSPVLLIELTPAADELSSRRTEEVIQRLGSEGIPAPEDRVVVRPFPGKRFETLLRIGWFLVFIPIGLVLLLQVLYFVTREPARR